jgi:hypothetical protein
MSKKKIGSIPLPLNPPHPDDPCYNWISNINESDDDDLEADEQTEPLYEED